MRTELLNQFNESLEQLHKIAKEKDKDVAVFLAQAIAQYADDVSLQRINDDIKKFVELWSK